MNILHINSYFSTSGLFSQLYDRQVQSGTNIKVYVPISNQYDSDRLAATGDYTFVRRTFNHRDRFIFPIKHQKILKDLTAQFDYDKIDLIHAHSLFSNGWLAWQLWKKHQIPFIVAVRNADARTFFQKMPWMRKVGIEIMEAASQIVFISKNTYNDIYDKYIPENQREALQAKTTIMANGIDNFWHENRYTDKVKTVHTPLRIVTTGKIMRQKRFVQLAEMSQKYSQNISPVELHVIGPTWSDRVVQALETFDHVTYHGPKTKEEILDIYRDMDLFAMLSYPETFGLVYAEAMSQGLPVIYTKGEGFDSFFPNLKIGVSVGKSDQIGFSQALDYIQKNYSDMSQNAVDNIDHFHWDIINEKYLALYNQLL